MYEEEEIKNHPLFYTFQLFMIDHEIPMNIFNEWRLYWYCWLDGWRSAKLSSGEVTTIRKRGF